MIQNSLQVLTELEQNKKMGMLKRMADFYLNRCFEMVQVIHRSSTSQTEQELSMNCSTES